MKKIVLIYLSILIFKSIEAQTPLSTKEIGLFIGEPYYLGELNQMHFTPFNIGGGLLYRYNYDDRIGIRTQLNYGEISGNDANSNIAFNETRNLNFSSQIIELSSIGEFNFFNFSYLSPKTKTITPFVFLGLGLFYHNHSNPNAENAKIKNFQAAIPMGLGLKFAKGKFGMTLEWGIRKTFTDYLDDVSTYYSAKERELENYQRGEEYNKDWYVFTGLTFFYNLTPKRMCPN